MSSRHDPAQSRLRIWVIALLLGGTISLFQLAACLLASGHRSPAVAYQSLNEWDSVWYAHIAEVGYVSTLPPVKLKHQVANVAFFPAYPILARFVSRLFRVPITMALLLTAQGLAILFWSLFFACVLRATQSLRAALFLGLAVFSHPAAFYLQAGYSESLFLAALLAFLLASTCRPPSVVTAIGSGIAMTATRIVGAPLAFIGVAQSAIGFFFSKDRRCACRGLGVQMLIALCSLAGIASFFLFCQFRWGHWDLYLQTQAIGWGLKPDYTAAFDPATWSQWAAAEWAPWKFKPQDASRIATSFYLALLLATAVAEAVAGRRGVKGFLARLPFYSAAALMLYMSVSGLVAVGYKSMIRYTFPVHVCWLIGVSMLLHAWPEKGRVLRYGWVAVSLVVMAYMLLMQKHFLELFTHGKWVA